MHRIVEPASYRLVQNPPRPDLSGLSPLRRRLYIVIFEHDTKAGKLFDVALLVAIVLSVIVVMLDSVANISARYGRAFAVAEWFFTVLFSIEYLFRLYSFPRAHRYAFSFFGVVDLLAVLPTYVSVFFPAGRFLLTIRVVRVLRVFRVLKLVHFLGEASVLGRALRASRHKIAVFLLTVLVKPQIKADSDCTDLSCPEVELLLSAADARPRHEERNSDGQLSASGLGRKLFSMA